jgi:hypothetical protein
MEPFEFKAEFTFFGTEYIVEATNNGEVAILEVEQKANGLIWRCKIDEQFTTKVTKKVGSYKTFSVFCKYLLSALQNKHSSLHFQIFTYKELDFLKNKNSENASVSSASSNIDMEKLNSKRFFIMTYEYEHDTENYPIPLTLISDPDPDRLIQTIERMNTEINFFRSSKGFNMTETQELSSMKSSANSFYSEPNLDYEKITKENDDLRSQIDEIESVVQSMPGYGEYMRSKDPFNYEYPISDSDSVNYKSPKVAYTEPIELKTNTQTSGFMPKDYVDLKKQVDELESELDVETQDNELTIEEQTKQLEHLRKEANETHGEGGKMKQRIHELEVELKDSLKRLDKAQRGIDPSKKTPTRRRYVSPGMQSNNSKKSSVTRTNRVPRNNFIERNKRVSSLPNNKQRTPSYARPTKQILNRHESKNRSTSNRVGSNVRGKAYAYGNRPPGYVPRSNGPKTTGARSISGSTKRKQTKPQVSGVFGRLFQSKQRDSPLRALNNNRPSPGYRVGGYKRSPATRVQKPSPGSYGVNKRSPGTRVTTNFQVSSRLYPGPGTKKETSTDRLSNSRTRRERSNGASKYNRIYGNTSKDRVGYNNAPRPARESRSGQRGTSNNRSLSGTRDKYKSSSSGVFDRLYGTSNTRKTSKPRINNKPPAKPNRNNYVRAEENSDLDIVHESSKREEQKSTGNKKENNFKAANSSMERREAAREQADKRNHVKQRDLVRVKDPEPTYVRESKPAPESKPKAEANLEDRFSRIQELIKKGNMDNFKNS